MRNPEHRVLRITLMVCAVVGGCLGVVLIALLLHWNGAL